MATKYTKGYLQFIKESEEVESTTPLKGYKADQAIERIKELMSVVPDRVRFGIPPDNLGRATTYKSANETILRIKDILHYYDSKKENVRFYCRSITYEGSWKATESLTKKIEGAGGFGEEKENINLKKVIDYFTQNPEDADNLSKITLGIDSPSIRKDMATEKDEEVEYTGGSQTAEAKPTEEKPTDSEI